MTMEFEVKGLKEIDAKLKQMDKKIGRKVMLGAMRPAAKMVQKEIQARAPMETGEYADSISVKAVAAKYGGKYQTRMEAFANRKKGGYKANWLEYGTSTNNSYPHFRPAADSKEAQAQKMMGSKIFEAIDKHWKS